MTRPGDDPDPGERRDGPTQDATVFVGTARLPAPRVPEYLPPIDPDELAGLASAGERSAAVRRVSPLQDEPSNLVARYLFPTERYRGEWKRHPIHLSTPLSVAVIATIGLGLVAGLVPTLAVAAFNTAWVAPLSVLGWLGVMGWAGWQIADWHHDRFILTNKRVMVVNGIITRNVAMMPLQRVTDMKYEQTPLARMLGYGTFVLESAGQDQALREIPHLPNPNELYLRVVEEMYEPAAVEERLGPVGDAENGGGDA